MAIPRGGGISARVLPPPPSAAVDVLDLSLHLGGAAQQRIQQSLELVVSTHSPGGKGRMVVSASPTTDDSYLGGVHLVGALLGNFGLVVLEPLNGTLEVPHVLVQVVRRLFHLLVDALQDCNGALILGVLGSSHVHPPVGPRGLHPLLLLSELALALVERRPGLGDSL